MGIFSKNSSPPMTEVWIVDLLKKFDSDRTPVDVIEAIMFISEGVLPMNSNNHQPRFKTIKEFDLSVREILGSLDEENFRSLVKMLLFSPEYLNKFISIAVDELENTYAVLRDGLGHDIPISVDSSKRISTVTGKTSLIIEELSHVLTDLSEYVTTDSMVAIARVSGTARDFLVLYLDELSRGRKYLEDYRDSLKKG